MMKEMESEQKPNRTERAARCLRKYGVTVIRVFTDDAARHKWEEKVWNALDEMPEYKKKGKYTQRVLGGFGALANPSSFHHPTIQELRYRIKKNISKPIFKHLHVSETIKLEMLFDRVCVRYKEFRKPGNELWHRDVFEGPVYKHDPLPRTLEDGRRLDEIFGGWINLSDRDTYFQALVGTHKTKEAKAAQRRGGGFATLDKEEIKERQLPAKLLAQRNMTFGNFRTNDAGLIIVPPGYQVIFYQRLLHAVKSGDSPDEPQLRLFVGHRLTESHTPLFDVNNIIHNNSVPPIPSGQPASIISKNHFSQFGKNEYFRTWGEKTFDSRCLFPWQTRNGLTYYLPTNDGGKRTMPSLREMGFPLYYYKPKYKRTMLPELLHE